MGYIGLSGERRRFKMLHFPSPRLLSFTSSGRDTKACSRSVIPVTSAFAVFVVLTLANLIAQSVLATPHYYRPADRETERLMSAHDSVVSGIVRERALMLWGDTAKTYLEQFDARPFVRYYRHDSVFLERRAVWRSGLYGRNLVFFDVSLYTVDGLHQLRETYALDSVSGRYAVIDSAGVNLFARTRALATGADEAHNQMRDFYLTLLAFAGYGDYEVIGNIDTTYHGIKLGAKIGKEFVPFSTTVSGDTTLAQFTARLLGGVEVSRWRLKQWGDEALITEDTILVTYQDIPPPVDEVVATKTKSASVKDGSDKSASANSAKSTGGNSMSAHQRGAGVSPDSASRDSSLGLGQAEADSTAIPSDSVPPRISIGDVRLSDLMSGGAPPPVEAGGLITFEIRSVKPMQFQSDITIDEAPEVITLRQPPYPLFAIDSGLTGFVDIACLLDTLGRARGVRADTTAGTQVAFIETAQAAVASSVFRAAQSDNKVVSVWLNIRLLFALAPRSNSQTIVPPPGDTTSTVTPAVDSLQTKP